VYTLTRIEGSNPSLTAKYHSHDVLWDLKRLKPQGFRSFFCLMLSHNIYWNPVPVGGI